MAWTGSTSRGPPRSLPRACRAIAPARLECIYGEVPESAIAAVLDSSRGSIALVEASNLDYTIQSASRFSASAAQSTYRDIIR